MPTDTMSIRQYSPEMSVTRGLTLESRACMDEMSGCLSMLRFPMLRIVAAM